MLDNYKLSQILFLDIETVPQVSRFEDLPERIQEFWDKKSSKFRDGDQTAAEVYSRAGIYAEFGKIICISVGIVTYNEAGGYGVRIKSFFGDDERILLEEFGQMLNKFSQKANVFLCAHNGKEFDFPYIARRMLINQVNLPALLNVPGKKPWEVPFLDTMELWKFGDHKHYTSLDLLTHIFGIPTPKDDIDGSMVGKIYWEENDLKRIVKYCEKDVMAIVQLFLKYRNEPEIPESAIETVTDI